MKAEYIDHMGDDLRVANAARVSFDKHSDDLTVRDYNLIGYLGDHNHWTPFSHCVVTLRETVPIFVARQRFKHTVGFSYNEVSRRYVDSPPEFYVPEVWRKRAENKKQGSSDEVVRSIKLYPDEGMRPPQREITTDKAYKEFIEHVEWLYNRLIQNGVCPEQARMVLPQSMYTSYYVTGSLAAWARAYKLRSDPHAQKEIQDLAAQWNQIIAPLFPVSWAALLDGSSSATTSASSAQQPSSSSPEMESNTPTTTYDSTRQLELSLSPMG